MTVIWADCPNWGLIYQMIKERKTFRDIYTQGNISTDQDKNEEVLVLVVTIETMM